MSFVPVSGPATFRPAHPPRDGEIEFTDAGGRRVSLPVRAALPVLARAREDAEAHPSVALLSGAVLLATRFVGAGKLAPATDADPPHWRIDGLDERDTQSVRLLADARRYDGLDAAAASTLVAQVLDAVADTLPRAAPAPTRVPTARRARPEPAAP
ncbi:hypothetical protein ABLM29_13900, partial [Nocardioides sp. YIM 152588]